MSTKSSDSDHEPQTPAGRVGRLGARERVLLLGLLVVATIVAALVTLPVGVSDEGQGLQPGSGFYAIGAETSGLQVGQSAPDLAGGEDATVRLTTPDGEPLRIADFAGRPLWIFFWATWCPPCQQETPDIQRAWEIYRDEGLLVLGVDIQEPAEAVEEYIATYSLTFAVGLDVTGDVMHTYGVFGLPTHYFIDREGIIRDRWFGPLTFEQMEQKILSITRAED